MAKVNQTHLEINLNALQHNYQFIKSRLPHNTQIMAVVKAFAYGTDAIMVGKKLLEMGASHLAVSFVEEGVKYRKKGITAPILVFYPKPENVKKLVKYKLTPSVYNFSFLETLENALLEKEVTQFPIHININTGMNRLGFSLTDLTQLQAKLNSSNCFALAGVFSHLATAGMPSENDFTNQQIETFKIAVKSLKANVNSSFISHICNSSGILSHPNAAFDLVRAGIALYGYANNPIEEKGLQVVASLKTTILQLREIEIGESVGYDRKYIASRKTKIATLPLGYADGISRMYGNQRADVLVNGKKAPIVGNVCMDTIMVDVTGIDCQEGDAVLIFGENHTALDFDKEKQSIPYELITRISQRVKRVVVGGN